MANGSNKEKPPKLFQVKLLAFNDFHGHLEANTPGSIVNPATGLSVPAGGAEYFATHMRALGSEGTDTYVVGAGDMIGGSPLLSGLFHDEPTIEFLNSIGVDTVGVGNHEFDEGLGRAAADAVRKPLAADQRQRLREQQVACYKPARPDGCHPVDGCQDGTPFFGSVFQYLAANVVLEDTGDTLLPPYEVFKTSTGERSPSSARRSRTRRSSSPRRESPGWTSSTRPTR